MNHTEAITIPLPDQARVVKCAIPARPLSLARDALKQYPIKSSVIVSAAVGSFSLEGLLPYCTKRLIDAITHLLTLTEQATTFNSIWLWGALLLVGFASAAGLLRISRFTGIRTITQIKTNTYRLLFRFLTAVDLNDDPGAAIQSIAFVGEGLESLLFKLFWQLPQFALVLGFHLGLMFTAHPIICGVLAGWVLLHFASNTLLLKWKKGFAVRYQQSTSRFKGLLVEFCRVLMFHPEKRQQANSEERYHLDQALLMRNDRNQLNWQIAEAIHLLYNILHTLFLIIITIIMIVLWQERLISTGDIAMGITIMLSTQRLLSEASTVLNQYVDDYSQVEAGLTYIHTQQQRGLPT